MTAQRRRLPNRRHQEVYDVEHDQRTFQVCVGRDPADGEIREVFITGAKPGSQLSATLDDASILISLALQHGLTPAAFRKSMSRFQTSIYEPATAPASPIAAAIDLLDDLWRSHQPEENRK